MSVRDKIKNPTFSAIRPLVISVLILEIVHHNLYICRRISLLNTATDKNKTIPGRFLLVKTGQGGAGHVVVTACKSSPEMELPGRTRRIFTGDKVIPACTMGTEEPQAKKVKLSVEEKTDTPAKLR